MLNGTLSRHLYVMLFAVFHVVFSWCYAQDVPASSVHVFCSLSLLPAVAELTTPEPRGRPRFINNGSIDITWGPVTAAQRYVVAFRRTDLPGEVPAVYKDNFPFGVTNAAIDSSELVPGTTYELLVRAVSITSAGGATFLSNPLVMNITTPEDGE